MQRARKSDKFLKQAINAVEIVAILVSIYDFLFNTYRFSWFNFVGLLSFFFGTVIYLSARRTLGKFFSEDLRLLEAHELVTSGIYRYIRHPVYAGGMFLLLGFTLTLNSLLGFLVMLLYIPLILIRIPYEEAMLREAFGQQYDDYVKRTKKLIPMLY